MKMYRVVPQTKRGNLYVHIVCAVVYTGHTNGYTYNIIN